MLNLRHEVSRNIKFETTQNISGTIQKELRHLPTKQVRSTIQNVKVEQVVNRGHIKDNAEDITKRIKVEAPDFDGRGDFTFFLDQLNSMESTSTGMTCQMNKEFDLPR